ncbi:hypothetical protein NCS57_01196000 [Fusarium keratoplasticum]|uniref:Uncharacterized protein n=1 Tax=Fusarium keratoplasticum TaxID=1328300 RepID=A0ACC0QGZ0_9HYPO|nr:hypothetical protein NCS57_01196000 [Fusarium keratoplasticum]KAI8654504.1 hypothetical protein NCS57_01196000 [Fusarium keratoplasticum]
MAPSLRYSVADVLAVAKIHPFYSDAQYPPDDDTIQKAREQAALTFREGDLQAQPLLRKKDLYTAIERLVGDTSPQNTYRHNVYTSTTGGGGGSNSLFFATDAMENRRHRANFGEFLRNTGVIQRGDWVLTTHNAGDLYRSLDLTLEILENAGATLLAAGNRMPSSKVVELLQTYHANALAGDGSQIVQVVQYISTMTTGRDKIKLDKIIYTSEALNSVQKAHIYAVLGPIKIFSLIGSAEAGPYGASNPDLTPTDPSASYTDFVIDTRTNLFEILPLSLDENDRFASPLPEGETGIIAQTSLVRLRNPLVRYVTTDIGSLHRLPDQAQDQIPGKDWPFMRILRLQGRDSRFSFTWDGEYIEFDKLKTLMSGASFGVLQWQVILDKMEPSKEASLEIRMLCAERNETLLSRQEIIDRLHAFLYIYSSNQHRFRATFVDDLDGFERSETGRKVIKFIDRFTT